MTSLAFALISKRAHDNGCTNITQRADRLCRAIPLKKITPFWRAYSLKSETWLINAFDWFGMTTDNESLVCFISAYGLEDKVLCLARKAMAD